MINVSVSLFPTSFFLFLFYRGGRHSLQWQYMGMPHARWSVIRSTTFPLWIGRQLSGVRWAFCIMMILRGNLDFFYSYFMLYAGCTVSFLWCFLILQ